MPAKGRWGLIRRLNVKNECESNMSGGNDPENRSDLIGGRLAINHNNGNLEMDVLKGCQCIGLISTAKGFLNLCQDETNESITRRKSQKSRYASAVTERELTMQLFLFF